MKKIILAIETSCDETAIALVEASGSFDSPSFNVLSHKLFSQADKHAEYGGVYPTLAKREHAKNLTPLLKSIIEESEDTGAFSLDKDTENKVRNTLSREPELLKEVLIMLTSLPKINIDIIAVTQGPGLEPALWMGVNFAKALSSAWNIPLMPINHMEGHIWSVLYNNDSTSKNQQFPKPKFPILALLISGGHTELVVSHEPFTYKFIGETRDDAVGEAYDKVARMLGLGYPGGPEIARYAREAREKGVIGVGLPRPMINTDDYDFSFSGLKTSVLYKLRDKEKITQEVILEFSRGFEDAVMDVLLTKTKKAIEEYAPHSLIIGGGVSANQELRQRLNKDIEAYPNTTLYTPGASLSTDNAIMIAMVAYLRSINKTETPRRQEDIVADGNLSLYK